MKRTYLQKPGEPRRSYLERAARAATRFYIALAADDYHAGHWTHAMSDAFRRTEKIFPDLGTFGVEGDCEGNGAGHIDCLYLNAGEMYEDTLLCGDTPDITVTSLGDYVESQEVEDNEENGTITCGYCSHHTPLKEGTDWHDCVCESCGWYVDGRGKADAKTEEA